MLRSSRSMSSAVAVGLPGDAAGGTEAGELTVCPPGLEVHPTASSANTSETARKRIVVLLISTDVSRGQFAVHGATVTGRSG